MDFFICESPHCRGGNLPPVSYGWDLRWRAADQESRYDCHRQSLRFKIRCALQHAPTFFGGDTSGRLGINVRLPPAIIEIQDSPGSATRSPTWGNVKRRGISMLPGIWEHSKLAISWNLQKSSNYGMYKSFLGCYNNGEP